MTVNSNHVDATAASRWQCESDVYLAWRMDTKAVDRKRTE